jgi:hypothetical protein
LIGCPRRLGEVNRGCPASEQFQRVPGARAGFGGVGEERQLGLPWQYTRGSALLGWVKDDAQHIASEIARTATRISEPRAVRTAA